MTDVIDREPPTPRRSLRSIPTPYGGYLFRSRLEARWAVFFDDLGLSWNYEAEGYDLGKHGFYLPDFDVSGCFFAEVKPMNGLDAEALSKLRALADNGSCLVLGLEGEPIASRVTAMDGSVGIMQPMECEFLDCRRCDRGVALVGSEAEYSFNCTCGDHYKSGGLKERVNAARVKAAGWAARLERFTT